MEVLADIPLIREGGTVMVLLYLLSLIGVGLVLERSLLLRRDRVLPEPWSDEVREVVEDQGLRGLGSGAGWPSVPAAMALQSFLREPAPTAQDARALAEHLADREQVVLDRGLVALGLCAALAPLLGLLGTVAGMIDTFRAISAGGIGEPQRLAAGIYQALYTTAAGLTLAIPLTVAHRFLRGRAEALRDGIADLLVELWWVDRRAGEDRDAAPQA